MYDPNDPQHAQHGNDPRTADGDPPTEIDPDGQQVPDDEQGTGTGSGREGTGSLDDK